MNGILEMPWFVHTFIQNKHMVSIVYALFSSFFRLLGIV